MSDQPKSPRLSYRTVGEIAWIDQSAALRIHEAVALPLLPGVTLDGLRAALHHAVLEVMMLAFGRDPRRRRQDIQRLRVCFLGYQNLARSLAGDDLFPPKMPSMWIAAVERWLADMDVWLEEPSAGGRPSSPLGTYLLPRLFSILLAAYGQRPTARRQGADGAAARLIIAVIRVVQALQDRIGFDQAIYDKQQRAQLRWQIPNPESLRVTITRTLQRHADPENETGDGLSSSASDWVVSARSISNLFFRM